MTTTVLTAADLFIPAPSGVGPYGAVPAANAAQVGTWLQRMLTNAGIVGLPTTSWQSGAPELTIFADESILFAESDLNISIFAQGGFLQTAASGTVVSVDVVTGVQTVLPVTPDPSNASQNPTGTLGWEDSLAQNVYGVTRLTPAFASGPLALVNLKGSPVGPYAARSYHVANTASGATYSNPGSLAIPSSAIAGSGGVVAGVTSGATTTIITTVAAHGLVAGQTVYVLIPTTSAVAGLQGVFAIVVSVTTTSFTIGIGSSGTWTSGGNVYLCTVATMQADVAGIGANASPGAVTTTVTQNAGVFASNVVSWAGSNWESNTALSTRCTLKLAAASPNGPSQAYVYFAETAAQLLALQSPPYTLTNGPVVADEFANPQTGIVTTVVASSTPASTVLGGNITPGCAQDPIAGITAANPAAISVANAHGLTTGMTVAISFPAGTAPAALAAALTGSFVVTVLSPTTFSVPVNTTALGAWTTGGSVEGGDLGAIDALLQDNVVPDGITAVTSSALALPTTVTAVVIVPQAYVAAYTAAVGPQLQAQLAAYPVGGNPNSIPANSVAWDDILAALEEAGVLVLGQPSYVSAVQSLIVSDGATTVSVSGTGIPFVSSLYQAVLANNGVQVTVIGV